MKNNQKVKNIVEVASFILFVVSASVYVVISFLNPDMTDRRLLIEYCRLFLLTGGAFAAFFVTNRS